MHTERDSAIVDWVGRIGAAGAEHVMHRFGMGRSWTYTRAEPAGRARRAGGTPGALPPTGAVRRDGGRAARPRALPSGGIPGQPGRVRPRARARGRGGRTALRVPGLEVLAERELRLVESDEGKLLASVKAAAAGGLPALHRPDLVLVADGRTLAVEVELSVKAPRRLQRICTAYARARHVDHVYYLAEPAPARAVAGRSRRRGPRAGSRVSRSPMSRRSAGSRRGRGRLRV